MQNKFPTNQMSFIAAAALTGRVTITRVGDFDFDLSPYSEAESLYREYHADQLVFSARLLADQIREVKRLHAGESISASSPET